MKNKKKTEEDDEEEQYARMIFMLSSPLSSVDSGFQCR